MAVTIAIQGFVGYVLDKEKQSRQLPYISYDLLLSNIKVIMVKGNPLKLNKSPSQHQNPVGKLGMGFDNEIRWWGPKV